MVVITTLSHNIPIQSFVLDCNFSLLLSPVPRLYPICTCQQVALKQLASYPGKLIPRQANSMHELVCNMHLHGGRGSDKIHSCTIIHSY